MNVGVSQGTGLWWRGNDSSGDQRGYRLTGNPGMNAFHKGKIITLRYEGSVTQLEFYTTGGNYSKPLVMWFSISTQSIRARSTG